MSKLFEYLNASPEEKEQSPISISLGLGISLSLLNEVFEEAHRQSLTGHSLEVSSILGTVADPCSGLYISNAITQKGVRMTRNGLACSGRLYFGNSTSIPYPERIPVEGKVDPVDYNEKDIPNMAKAILTYLTRA